MTGTRTLTCCTPTPASAVLRPLPAVGDAPARAVAGQLRRGRSGAGDQRTGDQRRVHGLPGRRTLVELLAERDRLRITVSNPLTTLALPRASTAPPGQFAESGRGLILVEHLSLALTSRIVSHRLVVAAELAVARRNGATCRRGPRHADARNTTVRARPPRHELDKTGGPRAADGRP